MNQQHTRRGLLALVLATLLLTPALALPTGASDTSEITIVRDQYGVPHVYGETAEDVSYGAGYALAEDRLWQMHVFRLIGKGQLSELLGPLVLGIDQEVRFMTYTEAERQARFERMPDQLRGMLEAFADGINAYIAQAHTDPSKMPFEFVEYGELPIEPWKVTDSIALQDVLILSFGSGGGNELRYAQLLQDLVEAHGETEGLARFNDLVRTVDDDGPITIPQGYDYVNESTHARVAEAEAQRALTPDARLPHGPNPQPLVSLPAAGAEATDHRGTLAQLAMLPDLDQAVSDLEALDQVRTALERVFAFGSNAQIVGPSLSETDNALQTGGPQVGYLLPQWLADFGLHSEDGVLDATGMTFAGAGPAVLIGRSPGYAWTTTTGSSDLTDTYVETLHPADPQKYLFDPDGDGPQPAQWEEMACRTETYAVKGVGFESEEVCRTRHGPVFSVDEDNHVAYSIRYAWFDREDQTVKGFFGFNGADSLEDYATATNVLASNHNMFYVDDQGNHGFWHPGNFPVRAEGVDLRLPQDGTGLSEWQGLVPVQETPHAVNVERGWIANWNNQPVEGWERERAYDPVDNANSLYQALDPAGAPVADPEGGLVNPDGLVDFEDLNANLRYGAFKDHTDTHFRPFLPAPGDLSSDLARQALATVQAWDGFLNDPDADGRYHAGTTILDAWADRMEARAFDDDLGPHAGWADENLLWHVLAQDDELVLSQDYLNGATRASFVADVFEEAVDALASEYGSQDPTTWQEEVDLQHYQRLNADLFADIAQDQVGLDNSGDQGLPGDVPDHIEMDRGTYNHIVAYQTPPTGSGVLGEAVAKAGSVIPPGQSGFVNLLGQEDPHYEDQLELYVEWDYKPMPLSLDEARSVAEQEYVLVRG